MASAANMPRKARVAKSERVAGRAPTRPTAPAQSSGGLLEIQDQRPDGAAQGRLQVALNASPIIARQQNQVQQVAGSQAPIQRMVDEGIAEAIFYGQLP